MARRAGEIVITLRRLTRAVSRYMHSPNEMVSLVDVDNAAMLIAEFCRAVTEKTDCTAR